MTAEPNWLSRKALMLLHQESLARFGGASGLADEGLFESALHRPRNTWADKPESTIAELAASYVFGFARNQPFTDGNKRVAFLSIGVFLSINGYRFAADQLDAIRTILALAAWIAANSRPLPEQHPV